jgi:restriction system protein
MEVSTSNFIRRRHSGCSVQAAEGLEGVGVKPIREVYGALMSEGTGWGILVTSGAFRSEAKAFAEGKPVQMIDSEAFVQLARPAQSSAGSATPVAL